MFSSGVILQNQNTCPVLSKCKMFGIDILLVLSPVPGLLAPGETIMSSLKFPVEKIPGYLTRAWAAKFYSYGHM